MIFVQAEENLSTTAKVIVKRAMNTLINKGKVMLRPSRLSGLD